MADYQFAFLTSTTRPGFLNAPPLAGRPHADVVVAGIGWDGATTNRPGARLGPHSIRRASHMLGDGWHCSSVRERLTATADTPVYLSSDIDCLDPAYAPGTGTPEPGGLATAQVMTLLEELHGLNWVGMDLCEVAPAYDHAELTSNAAATLVWTYLCGRIAPRISGA
jgi:arginase family enzyme